MTSRRTLLSPLGVRLAAAFVVVAVTSLFVLAALMTAGARSGVSELVADVHDEDTRAASIAVGRAYEQAGGWLGADLSNAVAIAARGQATLSVRNENGSLVSASSDELAEMMLRMHGVQLADTPRSNPVSEPVTVNGVEVGLVELRFPDSHLPGPERQVRDVLLRNVFIGVLLAVVVAIAVSIFVARRVTRPIAALTHAAQGVGARQPGVRVDVAGAPGELRTLANTFNDMAATIEHEDQLRRRLVADVSHELRTPLTILRGTTESLVDRVAQPDDSTLASLHEEVLRLSHLVDDLHTLASADAAVLYVRRQPTDLASIVAAVADLAAGSAEAADISIATALHPAVAITDPERIKQVVNTLVGNALVYTPAGGTITLRTDSEAGLATIRISDTGAGVDPDDAPHIFERFYRGRNAQGVGSGTGLAVAHELVTALDGSIELGGSESGGAAFVVRLPVDGTLV